MTPFIAPDGTPFEQVAGAFRWNLPTRFNIATATCTRHADGSGAAALFCERPGAATRTVSFDELEALSNRAANALAALGIARGMRVGIVLPQRWEAVVVHLAVYKLGAVALPLSRLFGADALRFRLEDSGAACVLCDDSRVDTLLDIAATSATLTNIINCDAKPGAALSFTTLLERASDRLVAVDTSCDDPALLIYTSGTTGPPKGALGAHRCLLGNLPGFELSQNYFPCPQGRASGGCMYTPADWAWTGGLLDALLPALYYGVPVLGDAASRFDAERMLDLVERHRVTNAFIPPTALKMTMQVPERAAAMRHRMRAIMSAGEQVGPEVLRFAEEVLRTPVNEMWGQTESNYLAGSSSACMATRPGAMGKAYPGHRVEVMDAAGQPVAAGDVGQLAVWRHDPVMFLGYWNNAEATAEKTLGNWWLTGDQGARDDDGYLWFVGRTDDVISTAGHRVGPGEIEDCLLQHDAVAQAAVIGVPDALRGQVIKAYIVLSDGQSPGDALVEALQRDVKQRLAAHEYPREIAFIDELPMTTTGKVRRVELRARDAQERASAAK